MSIRVLRDGQMVHRSNGEAELGANKRAVSLGTAVVCAKNQKLRDDEVSQELLELIKSGGHPGLAYVGSSSSIDEVDDSGDEGESVALQTIKESNDRLAAELEDANTKLVKVDDENTRLQTKLATALERVAELEAEVKETEQSSSNDATVGAPPSSGGSGEQVNKPYDPRDHTQAQVLEYLKGADADEVKRIQELEAGTQNRQQVMKFKAGSE